MKRKDQPLFHDAFLHKYLFIPLREISDKQETIQAKCQRIIKDKCEGKCIEQGFVKENSCRIITVSSPLIEKGDQVKLDVMFQCEVCLPVRNTVYQCCIQNITHAGLTCFVNTNNHNNSSSTSLPADFEASPLLIYVLKDHCHMADEGFSKLTEGDTIDIQVVGSRFKLNEKKITVIGKWVHPKTLPLEIDEDEDEDAFMSSY